MASVVELVRVVVYCCCGFGISTFPPKALGRVCGVCRETRVKSDAPLILKCLHNLVTPNPFRRSMYYPGFPTELSLQQLRAPWR